MKKILILTVIMLFAAAVAFGGVAGSKHDLNSATGSVTYKGSSEQICIYCHTPHQAQLAGSTGAPLWNRNPGVSTTGSYTSPTFNGTHTDAGTVSATITTLCMSCHDGGVAPAQHYENGAITDAGSAMAGRLFTGLNAAGNMDLSKQHPVDFILGIDAGINSTKIGIGSTYPLTVSNSAFTCATCHDVHDMNNNTMLRGTETLVGSAFCLACHNK